MPKLPSWRAPAGGPDTSEILQKALEPHFAPLLYGGGWSYVSKDCMSAPFSVDLVSWTLFSWTLIFVDPVIRGHRLSPVFRRPRLSWPLVFVAPAILAYSAKWVLVFAPHRPQPVARDIAPDPPPPFEISVFHRVKNPFSVIFLYSLHVETWYKRC